MKTTTTITNFRTKDKVRRKPQGIKKKEKKEDFYEAFEKFINEPYEPKSMGLSEEDKIIYRD